MCGTQWTTQTEILVTTGKLKAEGKLRTLRDKRDTRRSAKDAAQKALA